MDLQDHRKQIDRVDDELLRLFRERMETSQQIAQYKKEHGLPVLDAAREMEKLALIGEKAGRDLYPYAFILYTMLFTLSRSHQASAPGAGSITSGSGAFEHREQGPGTQEHSNKYKQLSCELERVCQEFLNPGSCPGSP